MDLFLFRIINQFAGKWFWLDALAIFFARYFEFVLIFFLFLFLVKNFKKYWPMIIRSVISAILARLVIVEFIRWLFPRPRPFITEEVNLLISHSAANSFPSGHAAFYFAIASIVYFYNKKAGILFFISAFLISFSRVFVGIHWPSDIFAGAVIGILSAVFISFSFRKFFSAAKK